MKSIKVLVADDHRIFREGIIALLQANQHIEVAGEAENGAEVLEFLKHETVDVVLLDINMPEKNGLEVAKYVAEHYPTTNILVCSSYEEDYYILNMIRNGVAGFVLKTIGSKDLISAIETVAVGDSYFSKEISKKIKQQFSKRKGQNPESDSLMTDREVEILKLVAIGLTNEKIGERLFISPRTVGTHRRNLMQKLQLHSAVQLARYAHEKNLLA